MLVVPMLLVPMLLVTVSACLQDRTGESSFDPARARAEDLDHYIERVLRPIADAILSFTDSDFGEAIGEPRQLDLL